MACISTSKENVRVPSGLQALLVQLLGRDERYHELRQFVAGKLIDRSHCPILHWQAAMHMYAHEQCPGNI